MKFLCPSCKAKYQIGDEKVAGRSVRMKCRKCGYVIQVSNVPGMGDALPGSEPPPAPIDALSDVSAAAPPVAVPPSERSSVVGAPRPVPVAKSAPNTASAAVLRSAPNAASSPLPKSAPGAGGAPSPAGSAA